MKYKFKKGKYIFVKDGTYFAMTRQQVRDMRDNCEEILGETSAEECERVVIAATKGQGW